MSKKIRIILALSIITNIILFAAIFNLINQKNLIKDPKQYQYLSKRLFTENQNDFLINFVDLRSQLYNYLQDKPYFGLYFEYLPSGVSIGINQNNNYVIASLLKVPLVMAVYHYIEKNQISLNDALVMRSEDVDKNFGDFWKKGVGTKISVKDAIELVITKSDNTALKMLANILPSPAIDDVFDSLDIAKSVDNNNDVIVTPKNYSSILRSLYLSSYVGKKYSNEILSVMTKSDFNDKMTSGIPDNIPVAHKIGTYHPLSIYTDCGIVYAPVRPYILCLMSHSDETTARNVMKNVSKMVYDYVTSAH